MIDIGNRMELMASMVNVGETVGDIGTDHGLLPLKLFLSKKSSNIILSDVSKPSLEKARENFKEAFAKMGDEPQGEIEFRVGNGLKAYNYHEVDTIIIAGMGGRLICKILEDDLKKSHSISKYILQPRNGTHILRRFLVLNGFRILEEALVREGKFICEIICAISQGEDETSNNEKYRISKDLNAENILWEIPIAYQLRNQELLDEFIIRKILERKNILETIENSAKEKTREQIVRLKEDIKTLEGVKNEI